MSQQQKPFSAHVVEEDDEKYVVEVPSYVVGVTLQDMHHDRTKSIVSFKTADGGYFELKDLPVPVWPGGAEFGEVGVRITIPKKRPWVNKDLKAALEKATAEDRKRVFEWLSQDQQLKESKAKVQPQARAAEVVCSPVLLASRNDERVQSSAVLLIHHTIHLGVEFVVGDAVRCTGARLWWPKTKEQFNPLVRLTKDDGTVLTRGHAFDKFGLVEVELHHPQTLVPGQTYRLAFADHASFIYWKQGKNMVLPAWVGRNVTYTAFFAESAGNVMHLAKNEVYAYGIDPIFE